MKFPKRLRHNGKGRVLATIYQRDNGVYRLYWRARVDGKPKSRFKDFTSYGQAKREGDRLLPGLAKGHAPVLSPAVSRDAMTALEVLQGFYERTGKRLSLALAIADYCENIAKLPPGRTLADAVDGWKRTVAVVRRKSVAEAVKDFLAGRKHLVEAKDGKRSRRSADYEYHVSWWLNEFAGTLSGDVCDLTKDHLSAYIGQFKELSPKSRNDRRAVVKMFLRWCAVKDYLPQQHRLFEADGFAAETLDANEIDYYRPSELRNLLDAAGPDIRPALAICGLAGLRVEECLRLDWADVWRVEGKIEISARIAKGRQRRLVTICDSLAQWLQPFRESKGRVCDKRPMQFNRAMVKLRQAAKVPPRRNGLRHGFVTFHFAIHCNEHLTAAEAGNSPQIIHTHYRGLATRKEAEAWFAVAPEGAANVIPFRRAE